MRCCVFQQQNLSHFGGQLSNLPGLINDHIFLSAFFALLSLSVPFLSACLVCQYNDDASHHDLFFRQVMAHSYDLSTWQTLKAQT